MTFARALIAVAGLVGAAASGASAQGIRFGSPQVYDDTGPQFLVRPAEDEVISLEGLDAIGRPRGERDLLGGDGPPRKGTDGAIRGGVGNSAVGNRAHASVGFTYLTPFYTFSGFQRAVPQGFENLFPVFGTAGNADSSFAFSPRIDLNYYVEDLDLSIGTAGAFLNLTGRVDRQASGPGGPGQLNAQSSLTLISAIPVEFGRVYYIGEDFPKRRPRHAAVADSTLDLRLGSRYVSVDQNYTGVTTSGIAGAGGSTSNRYSSQSYRGLGVTAATVWQVPLRDNWVPFLSARQSLTLGENRRNSTVTVTAPGVGYSDNQFDNRTLLSPATELEWGFDWGRDLAHAHRNHERGPAFNIRVAAVAQYWYGLGPLSAGPDGQGFQRNDLFLVGGYLQAGLKF